jgi:hypothetical protein
MLMSDAADIKPSEAKAKLNTALTADISSKAVRDFCTGNTKQCADAKCGYDKNGGWETLGDKSMYHEIDRIIAFKYGVVADMRPDLLKPPVDSYYWWVSADGKKTKLMTHQENREYIVQHQRPIH